MKREQFKQLTDVFWKHATAQQLSSTYHGYLSALDDIPPDAIDAAIRKALRQSQNMPRPAQLREWATATIPKTEVHRVAHEGPCAFCKAIVMEAGYEDGSHIRLYVSHAEACPNPVMSKPDDKVWFDDRRSKPAA